LERPTVSIGRRAEEPERSDKVRLLQGHPFFGDLPEDLLTWFVDHVKCKSWRAGELIFSKGDQGDAVFIVRRGTVKIAVSSIDGREVVISLIEGPEVFGEIAMLDEGVRSADASAFTDCEVLSIGRREMFALFEKHPPLMIRQMRILCERLRRTTEQVETIAFDTAPERLAKVLLILAENASSPGHILVAQHELAQMAAMSREQTNKQLRKWAQEAIITLARKEITILRLESLSKLVSM
jgi:CRP/FNR family cyclic AMP-dependent transcriptional regulator